MVFNNHYYQGIDVGLYKFHLFLRLNEVSANATKSVSLCCDGLSVLSPGIWAPLSVPLSWKIASSLDPSFANIFRQSWAPPTQNHLQTPTPSLTLSGHYTADVHPLQLLQLLYMVCIMTCFRVGLIVYSETKNLLLFNHHKIRFLFCH